VNVRIPRSHFHNGTAWIHRVRALALISVLAGAGASAQSFIPESEALALPTPARLAAIQAAAQKDGWAAQKMPIHALAQSAYEREKLPSAAAWIHVCYWAALFGENESDFVPAWIRAVEAAHVGHTNMAKRYASPRQPLGRWVAPNCQAWLMGNVDFSDQFFSLIQPVDYLPQVFRILDALYGDDPARFKKFANLALAIAVVYDIPPPPDWPHQQVPADVLPRRWPDPLEAFKWWTHEDQLGHTYHHLAQLRAEELKFVVDAAASFNELDWSQHVVDYPLAQLPRAYSMIHYRRDRAANQTLDWPGKSYALSAILGAGGICVDQAYFATEVGKARGVPTLFFHGAGDDGRHAWFGFLDGDQHWQLDAGRYAEQRYVTGFARDPQTWLEISDHELKFLAERFHALPSFRQSRVHAEFAADYLANGNAAAAAAAARKAVNYERRNQPAWETLVAAEARLAPDPKRREGTLREAIRAFEDYPELEVYYSNRLSESLRARGEISAADFEQSRIARKYELNRSDLSVQEARDSLMRSFNSQTVAGQIRAYNLVLEKYGRDEGVIFFDQIVVPFIEHLTQLGERSEALHAAERARNTLKVSPGSQLEKEFDRTLDGLRK